MLNRNENTVFNNSEIKLSITEFFGNSIQMFYLERKNESMFMYSSKIRSLDGVKIAAKKLRKSLLSFDFELNDKFCDAAELK